MGRCLPQFPPGPTHILTNSVFDQRSYLFWNTSSSVVASCQKKVQTKRVQVDSVQGQGFLSISHSYGLIITKIMPCVEGDKSDYQTRQALLPKPETEG